MIPMTSTMMPMVHKPNSSTLELGVKSRSSTHKKSLKSIEEKLQNSGRGPEWPMRSSTGLTPLPLGTVRVTRQVPDVPCQRRLARERCSGPLVARHSQRLMRGECNDPQ